MGFIRDYKVFFNVKVVDYTTDSPLAMFSFLPRSNCQQLLVDHQLIFRNLDTGFSVYFAENPIARDPVVGKISSRVRFGFAMRLKDSSLFSRYSLVPSELSGPQFYLDNLLVSGAIQPLSHQPLCEGEYVGIVDSARICPHIFFVKTDLSRGIPPTKYMIKQKFEPSATIKEVLINVSSGSGVVNTKIDLADQTDGPYLLDTDDDSARTIYVDNTEFTQGNLGVIDIYWEVGQDSIPEGGLSYTLPFHRQ